ncbi:MAG: CopG family transcriptional regulator [SAR324 cluster bacterium]|nr:CopG family transcriptional regulator [SAR324 cluster bacterium]
MKAEELDELFDKGDDITPYLDLSTAQRPSHKQRSVKITFPEWMIHSVDLQASQMGVSRQDVIKIWIAERLKSESGVILSG